MRKQTQQISYCALMCALLVISTLWIKFHIPGTSILFTTQVFFILLCGQLFTPSYCLYAIGAYLALGLIGLPVFSATQGPAVMATPTFGYLLAFPFSAMAVSWFLRHFSNFSGSRYAASLAGIVVMYLIALPYIALLNALYLKTPIPLEKLFVSFCFVFLPMDIVKGVLASLLAPRLAKALQLS